MNIFRLIYEWWCMELRYRYVRAHAALKEAEHRRAEAQLSLNIFRQELPDVINQAVSESRALQAK